MIAFTPEQLSTLSTILDEGTFEGAARRLHVTASAVSQRIKAMELTAGQILVERSNPVRLTAAGDVVLRYARQVELLQQDTARELGRAASDSGVVTLPVAVNADSLATWFLEAAARLHDETGVAAVFDIHRDDQDHTAELLRSGAVMAAVTSASQAVQGCSVTSLGRMRYRAVCSPSFARRFLDEHASVESLGSGPVVNFDRKDQIQRQFYRECTGRSLRSPRHYVPTSADYARAVVFGMGWGMLPEQQCAAEIDQGVLLDLAPEHPIDIALYWQRWNLASPTLDAVSSVVESVAREQLR
jgi:LysR family transcriptional regulator (chromosome initiation inhibitor)